MVLKSEQFQAKSNLLQLFIIDSEYSLHVQSWMIRIAAMATTSGASACRSELHRVNQECATCAQGSNVVRYELPGRELMASTFFFCQHICINIYCGPFCDICCDCCLLPLPY